MQGMGGCLNHAGAGWLPGPPANCTVGSRLKTAVLCKSPAYAAACGATYLYAIYQANRLFDLI
jgi:hypothetical protein